MNNLHFKFYRDWWRGTWTYFTSSETGKVCVHLILRPKCTHQIFILGMRFLGDEMNLKGYLLAGCCSCVINWYVRNSLFVFCFLEWRIFDIWCLHIPVADRTSFTGTVFPLSLIILLFRAHIGLSVTNH